MAAHARNGGAAEGPQAPRLAAAAAAAAIPDDRMEITTNFSNDPLMVPTISLAELKQITRNFRNDTLIGGGLYGNVFFGVLKDGQKSAILKLDPNSIEETFLEFPVVSRFKHEMLSSFLDTVLIETIVFLLMSMHPGDPCTIFFMDHR